jgi:membrane protease YdiL (CAAX protease family)
MNTFRQKARPIAWSVGAPVIGFFLLWVLKFTIHLKFSALTSAIINLLVVALVAFVIFPKKLCVPFGKVELQEFLHKTGFYIPKNGWKHILLGLTLAFCTLSGMLIASILTGRYVLDTSNITLSHLVFSLNPALWEELFFRGIIMIILLRWTGSLKKTAIIQIILFGLSHIKGFSFWGFMDVISVMVMAFSFTYAAYKTNSLLVGVIFHYFHDAFLFFVQPPDGVFLGIAENLTFYVLLWLMLGLGCLLIRIAAERLDVRSSRPIYVMETD